MALGSAWLVARIRSSTSRPDDGVWPGMGREDLYVAMSRGRHTNRTYVVVDQGDTECLPGQAPSPARDVLEQILATSHAEQSATETWDTYHPDLAAPVVPPARPQQPWSAVPPQPTPHFLTSVPPPSAHGRVAGL